MMISAHFYKCFTAILLFRFIQIVFIYKLHAREINVSFMTHFSLIVSQFNMIR